MFDYLDPYSILSLHKRASKLEECPYKLILNLAADQLEAGKTNRDDAKKAIEYMRTNDPTLQGVALKMLNLNPSQIAVAIHLLEKME